MATLKDVRRAGTLLSDEFIQILDEYFPDKMPEPGTSHDRVQHQMGAITVIRTIKEWKRMLDHPDQFPEDTTLFN